MMKVDLKRFRKVFPAGACIGFGHYIFFDLQCLSLYNEKVHQTRENSDSSDIKNDISVFSQIHNSIILMQIWQEYRYEK